jgi:hypothetical protein
VASDAAGRRACRPRGWADLAECFAYGAASPDMLETIRRVAHFEALLLNPVSCTQAPCGRTRPSYKNALVV